MRKGEDVDANKVIRASGVWRYAPDLCDPATRDLVYCDAAVTWTKDGVKGPGQVTFKVSAANVVTSAKLSLRATGARVSVSRDAGINWSKVDLASGKAECLEQVAGVTEYLVKVDLAGPESLLSSILVETITQLNRAALPRLARGPNRIQVRLGPQVETIQFQPSVVGGNHKKTAFSEKDIDVESDTGFYKPTLRPAEKGTPCQVTWKIETPTPITDLVYGGTVCVKTAKDRVTLSHSWDDRDYARDFQKTDGSAPFDLMVNAAVTSAPAAARTAYLRYEFQTEQYARSYSGPGIQTALMTVHHQPRAAGFAPLEVTYCWVEHRDSGDVERRHTEIATSPAHEYTLNVGGFRDPTMKWVRVNLKGQGPDGAGAKAGYSDGQDVGPGAKPPWVRYRWGKNLALGKPYTLEGKQDERNPDGGGDLTDGLIAPPDTYVSVKYMPTNIMFAKDVSPVVTLDLGSPQPVAAVRVNAGQEGGFHLSFPDAIAVETSTDGRTFAPAGSAGFKQVFEPPADYVPWELVESALFQDLPAGGRLAYAYRILFEKPVSARYVRVKCAGRNGWGMMLSEVEVFDKVAVDRTVPPLVVLPPIALIPQR
ncbi:MAG: discoidin domain-containing protein [Planctomycetota bacterium]|nr:discoidin domain-containing protein [Planctomycetota bacterium]